jgi:hypothetical protein
MFFENIKKMMIKIYIFQTFQTCEGDIGQNNKNTLRRGAYSKGT